MFAKNSSNSVDEYLANVVPERQEIINFLHKFIQESAPSLKPHFAYNMLGYGSFEYFDKRAKENKSWPIVALASQKNYVSLYVCAVDGQQYLAEKYKDQLGKVNVGKSCIRFKKLEDLDLKVVKKVLREAANSPGLVGA
jgi:uncharacterized protein YdhG (YjbR/CyaY superfamily)